MAAILPAIALAIHPYLAVLTFAVIGAIPVTLAVRRASPPTGLAFAGLGASLVLFAIAAVVLGYLGASLQGTGGFGQNPLPILSPVVPSMSALFGGAPGRATGGPVTGGQAYMVGERGPELFVPTASGRIAPGGGPVGGGINITVNVATPPDESAAFMQRTGAQIARHVRAALDRADG